MSEYTKTQPRRQPKTPSSVTAEQRYWRSFKQPCVFTALNVVSRVRFCPADPRDLLITSGPRVHVYDPLQRSERHVVSIFRDTAYAAEWRSDGKLFAAGGEEGIVRVFDPSTRTPLRMFKGHTKAVRCVAFGSGNTSLMSGSDDGCVRLWDVATEQCISTVQGAHSDYVRCCAASSASPDIFATGGYDHLAKLWDMRAGQAVQSRVCAHPVEDVLMLPSGAVMVTAAQNEIRFWSVLGGGGAGCMSCCINHQKTVTCLRYDGSQIGGGGSASGRVLSGSLDRHVKVLDVNTFKVTHSCSYPDPILSLDISSDAAHIAVGMSTSSMCLRTRSSSAPSTATAPKAIRSGSYKYFNRGASAAAADDDYRVPHAHKLKLRPVDKLLKKFRYKEALDAALAGQQPVVVCSVLEELSSRDGLNIAFAGRDEANLEPFLHFLCKYVADPRFAGLLIDVCNALFDLYIGVLGQSPKVDDLFFRLHNRVQEEVQVQRRLLQMQGSLELLMAAASR